MSAKNEIKKKLMSMTGRYGLFDIFYDWILMSSISIQNACWPVHDDPWNAREKQYMETAQKYTEEEMVHFAEMMSLLFKAFAEGFSDVLGELYMELGLSNRDSGQVFTPFHVSELMARSIIGIDSIPQEGVFTVSDPCCGGGAMLVAACKVLMDAGVDYGHRMFANAQDLDWKCVYMTYLQLSVIGCPALVVQGDTLTEPYDPASTDPAHVFVTPATVGLMHYENERRNK